MGAFIQKEYDCVFIHIPKTAGSTIRNGVFKGEGVGPHFNELPVEWQDKFAFAFVRNPYDRLVSAWRMFSDGMQNTKWSHNAKHHLVGIDFLNFLKIAVNDGIDHHKRDTIESVLRHHTLPQVSSYHCFQYADFIGKFENLNADFDIIAKKIGMADYNIGHLNKTKRKSYKEYYDDKTFDIVTEYYKEDIKRFDYSF